MRVASPDRENPRKPLKHRILYARVAQLAYFCVWPWFFSGLAANGVGTAAGRWKLNILMES